MTKRITIKHVGHGKFMVHGGGYEPKIIDGKADAKRVAAHRRANKGMRYRE